MTAASPSGTARDELNAWLDEQAGELDTGSASAAELLPALGREVDEEREDGPDRLDGRGHLGAVLLGELGGDAVLHGR